MVNQIWLKKRKYFFRTLTAKRFYRHAKAIFRFGFIFCFQILVLRKKNRVQVLMVYLLSCVEREEKRGRLRRWRGSTRSRPSSHSYYRNTTSSSSYFHHILPLTPPSLVHSRPPPTTSRLTTPPLTQLHHSSFFCPPSS